MCLMLTYLQKSKIADFAMIAHEGSSSEGEFVVSKPKQDYKAAPTRQTLRRPRDEETPPRHRRKKAAASKTIPANKAAPNNEKGRMQTRRPCVSPPRRPYQLSSDSE